MDEYKVMIQVSEEASEWLAEQGFDPIMGARPLKRAVQKHMEGPLAAQLLAGKYKAGDTILVLKQKDANSLAFERIPGEEPTTGAEENLDETAIEEAVDAATPVVDAPETTEESPLVTPQAQD